MGNMVLHMREYRNKEINNCPINLMKLTKVLGQPLQQRHTNINLIQCAIPL